MPHQKARVKHAKNCLAKKTSQTDSRPETLADTDAGRLNGRYSRQRCALFHDDRRLTYSPNDWQSVDGVRQG